ncbi:hypothetical protein DPSP01_004910 [Paraphaeosphaeria sporulosa]|uniref:Rhodopsin domain-containing protein n=1 Tax=Paraphaeosphaeria sporulosa TaxID=1460663 RepID=A0A177C8Z5_9PLEO|nr:uncharacterized protein CC84DRAFT_1261842 [Paraphaeosphaeria sporulosa]OAG03248.1 hypothetical protein CC84DRAFT_1261842 [Paraphaeosphaeria sporulosa]
MQDMLTSLLAHGGTTIVVASFFAVLTTVGVVLRLITNWSTKAKYGWGEACIITALGLYFAQYGVQVHGIVEGRKMKSLMDPHLTTYLRAVYIAGEFYFPVIFFTNMSILFLYRRLFPVQSFKLLTTILMVAHALWVIPAFAAETAMCSPPSVLWEAPLLIPEKCFFYSTFFIVMCSVELVLDVCVLALPLFYVSRLKLPWPRKAELSFIFLLGGLVVITGIVRILKSAEAGVQAIDFVLDMLWLDVHSGIAILCACLPTYRPLIVRSAAFLSSHGSKLFSSRGSSAAKSAGKSGNSNSTGGNGLSNGTIGSGGGYKKYEKFGSLEEVQLVGLPRGADRV